MLPERPRGLGPLEPPQPNVEHAQDNIRVANRHGRIGMKAMAYVVTRRNDMVVLCAMSDRTKRC